MSTRILLYIKRSCVL